MLGWGRELWPPRLPRVTAHLWRVPSMGVTMGDAQGQDTERMLGHLWVRVLVGACIGYHGERAITSGSGLYMAGGQQKRASG